MEELLSLQGGPVLDAMLSCILLGQCLAGGRWHDRGQGPSAPTAELLGVSRRDADPGPQENGQAARGSGGDGGHTIASLGVTAEVEWALSPATEGASSACRSLAVSLSTHGSEGREPSRNGHTGGPAAKV